MQSESGGNHLWWGLAVLVAAALLYFAWLGITPLTDRDEGEYAAACASMARSGDYLIPQLNGRPYLEKPILIFWAVAASQALCGPGETAARLPSALAAILLLAALGLFTLRSTRRGGLAVLAMAALGFSPLYVMVARMVLTDMLLALFTTISLLCCFVAGEKDEGCRPWYLAGWLALALGFLTKGPVALAVVLPSVGIYALWRGRLWQEIKRSSPLWGLIIFLVVNGPWYGLAFYRLGDQFWQGFFLAQNFTRFSEVLLGHGGGLFYYIPVIWLLAFPFSPAAAACLGRALKQGRSALNQAGPDRRLLALSGVAALVVLVVFSLAATKQINYILPALPFWAILAGDYLDRLRLGEPFGRAARGAFQILWWGGAGLWLAVVLAAPAVLYFGWEQVMGTVRFDSTEYAFPLQSPVFLFWPACLAACLLGMVLLYRLWLGRGQAGRAVISTLAAGALFCGLGLIGFWSQICGIIQAPAVQMTQEMKARLGKELAGVGMFTYGLWKPSLLYYLDRDVANLPMKQEPILADLLAKRPPVLVLSRVRLARQLSNMTGFQEIKRYEGYLLAGNPAAVRLWNSQRQPEPGRASPGP